MSDLPLNVDDVESSVAEYEKALAETNAAIVAAEDDDSVDLAGMCELIQARDRLSDIITRLTGLAGEVGAAA